MRRAALAALTVVVMFTAPACRGGDASRTTQQQDSAAFVPVDPNSASPTDRAIGKAQSQIQADPGNDTARLDLADAFLQKAREVGDPSLYVKASGILDGLAKRQSKVPDVWIAKGTLALAQHRFKDALGFGHKAVALSSDSQAAYGILVDANNELGNADDALAATQTMADIKPNLTALSRVSYARELRGDLPGAIEAMKQAITAGGTGGGENVAYVQTLLGGLLLTNGDVAAAESAYEQALASFPDFAAAKAGQAKVLVAQGKYSDAADVLDAVIKRQPLAEYAVSQGDALIAAGRAADADRAYQLVDVITRLYAANGVNVDREAALFDADHHPGKAVVDQARKALKDRGSLAGHDALAWALFKTNSLTETAHESDVALSGGSKDPQEHFHAAVIAMAQNNRVKATDNMREVLATNSRFSAAYIGQVTDLASQLGLTMPPPFSTASN